MRNNEKYRHIKRGKGNNPNSRYFNDVHERAIIQYKSLPPGRERDQLFEKIIYPAFVNIVDNLVNVYSLNFIQNIEDVKSDCVSFLSESLVLFNPELGFRAFSFFSVIAKNWLLQYSKKYNKNRNIFIDAELYPFGEEQNIEDIEPVIEQEEFSYIMKDYISFLGKNLRKNTNLYKVFLGFCVFVSACNNYSISSYNRKAMVDFISNYTTLDKKKVSVSLYRLKKIYNKYSENKNQ